LTAGKLRNHLWEGQLQTVGTLFFFQTFTVYATLLDFIIVSAMVNIIFELFLFY